MRKIFLLLFSLYCVGATAQNLSDKYLFDYIKVWGFLKYYHPAVGSGRTDADVLFMGWIEKVRAAKTDKEYDAILTDIFQSPGRIPQQTIHKDTVNLLTVNDNTSWIGKDKLLSASLRSSLLLLRKQGYTDSVHQYMPSGFFATEIPAERSYDSVHFPNINVQLLALARYWNAIEYMFPYKYMITTNWDVVLKQQLPFFARPMTPVDFELHLLQLNAAIEDTHGGIVAIKQSSKIYGAFFPPFLFEFAGDTLVVTDYLDSISCAQQDIRKGDLITGVRNMNISKAVESCSRLVSASNLSKKKSLLASIPLLQPLRGNDSVISIQVLRDGRLQKKKLVLQRLVKEDLITDINNFYRRQTGNGSTTQNDFILRSVSPDIAQIDAARLSILYNSSEDDRAIDSVLQSMRSHKKAILLDLRCYATQAVFYNKFLPALGWNLEPFAKLMAHYVRYPGTYYEQDIFSPVPKYALQSAYPGKVIVLVNEQTLSQSELITMIMQGSGPVTVIGTQTGGCDGDRIVLPVPGGYELHFSGRHVAYPDGTPSQKTGVKRDVKITRTAKGVAEGRDEILEAALKVAEDRR